MRFVDVNVLVYAHRSEAPSHDAHHAWLHEAMIDPEPLAIADVVLAGFVRVVTHPRVFKEPSPAGVALAFASAVRSAPAALRVTPGPRTWPLVEQIITETGVRGNDVHDAYLAAMAIEHGATLVSADRGFARFRALNWRHPLDS